MFDRISFVLGEAFIAMRRNVAMSFATIVTAAVSLFLLGSVFVVYRAADAYAESLPRRFDVRAFLKPGTSFEKIRATAGEMRKIPGVADASWIPRDKQWEKMKRENPTLTEGLENPLPDAFKITLSDLHRGEAVAKEVEKFPDVEKVTYLGDEQKIVIAAIDTFRVLGPIVGAVLFLASGILIYNTIRLTVLSRRLEVRIMQLVGATRFVVNFPFLVEGLVQGLLGGVCAGGLLLAAERYTRQRLAEQNFQIASFATTEALLALVAIGAGYGLLCSLVAVRAPLKYR